jgi:SAM-dependent methyltransferase
MGRQNLVRSGDDRLSGSSPREDGGPADWADPSLTYDVVADRYAERFRHELETKPFDRDVLTRFALEVSVATPHHGPVGDLGCGPGHIGAFLAERGATVFGLDRSASMTAQARRHYPALLVCQGDMTALGLRSDALIGIVCFYALIHIPRVSVPTVLREFHRVLTVGGSLLLAVHGGEGSLHATEMLDQPVALDATLFTLPELVGLLEAGGFDVVEAHERDPYDHEVATPRLYVWAAVRA